MSKIAYKLHWRNVYVPVSNAGMFYKRRMWRIWRFIIGYDPKVFNFGIQVSIRARNIQLDSGFLYINFNW